MFTGSSWEVAVHATVVELDVCVTRVFGDGRRTWFGVVLASSDLSVSILATVAVYVSLTCRSHPLVGVLDVLSDSEDDGRGTLVVGVLVGSTPMVEVQTFSRYLGRRGTWRLRY